MRRIVFIGVALALAALLAGTAQAAFPPSAVMSWSYDAHPLYNDPMLCICRGQSGGYTCMMCCLDYSVSVTNLDMDVILTVTPGPNNHRDAGPYTIPPGPGTHTVCLDDLADLTYSLGGSYSVTGQWGDTPSIEWVSELGTYCGGQDRNWHWQNLPIRWHGAGLGSDGQTGFSVQCAADEPDVEYNGDPTPTSFVFDEAGAARIDYSQDVGCNLDIGATIYGKFMSFAQGGNNPLDPEDSRIYRSKGYSKYFNVEVLEPLQLDLETSASVNRVEVYPGQSFIGTVSIRNLASRRIYLDDYAIYGDIVEGGSICSFTLTPGSVPSGGTVEAIIECMVPSGASPQTIDGIYISFNTDMSHPCTDDIQYVVPIPPVDVIEEPLGPCEDGIDNDGDGKIDCWDNDGAEDCCMSPACPMFRTNEGANNFICCYNGLNEDGDAGRDCLDTDCCLAPLCPYDDDLSSEGKNNKLCCSNFQDDDNDGLTDLSDPDCLDLGPCEDGIDNDGDGKIDCLDNNGAENCCMDPTCPFKTNEGANNFICCTNNLNEDGDSGQDCFDTDCCMAPLCPYDNTPNSEGLNGMICCSNFQDDDNDGLTDGADPDCVVLGPCEDGIDNDHDGLIDCNDAQEGGVSCCIDPACPMFRTNEGANNFICCYNGLNEDGNGKTDCLDVECCPAANCPYDDNANSEGLNGKLCCANSLDEDGDGLADGADPDCIILGPCEDGIDNDADGLIDCLDPEEGGVICCASPACPVYAINEGANVGICCNNTIDEDNDSAIDCLDTSCCTAPTCPYVMDSNEGANDKLCCANSLDEDGDGFTDLLDTDCQLPYETCSDGIDNDGDGLIDCFDPYCCNDTVACPVYLTNEGANGGTCCANLRDEDSNGAIDCLDASCCAAVDECPIYLTNEGANGGVCCANTADEDNDTAADCLDDSCCAAPTCPYIADEGANGGICCGNELNEDGGGMDCLDVDCCTAPICPYDDNFNSEGLNGMICCSNNIDDDKDGKKDSLDPDCIVLGAFNDMVRTGEIRIFDVRFGDTSVTNLDPVPWDFLLDSSVDYAGSCLIKESISKQDEPIPKNDGLKHHISDLVLQTTSDDYCAVAIHANAPDGTEVNGSYMLDAGSLPPIDPNAQIPEIPSVIHPVDIYSSDPEDAQAAYNLAEGLVTNLLADCGTDCGGNAAAKAKLDDAWRHLKAAERYLTGCLAGQRTLCRFSQYYSERANQLARAGRTLLG